MVTIVTVPRQNNEYYFAHTYEEVRRQLNDDTNLVIVVDGDYAVLATHNTVLHVKKKRPGNRDAFFAALKFAYENKEDLLFLEDDLRFCKNAIPYMLGFSVPLGIGWVQFFTPGPVRRDHAPGLHIAPPGTSMFNQALLFPVDTLRRLTDWNDVAGCDMQASDGALKQASRELGISWASHVPDLVQHIGEVSVYDDGRRLEWWRKSGDFPGEAFDAMTLKDNPWH